MLPLQFDAFSLNCPNSCFDLNKLFRNLLNSPLIYESLQLLLIENKLKNILSINIQ